MKTVAGLLGGGVHAESQMLAIYDFEEQLAKVSGPVCWADTQLKCLILIIINSNSKRLSSHF